MWITFAACGLLTVLFLYLPGVFYGRVLGFGRIVSLCGAPVFTLAAMAVLNELYFVLGIPCSWVTVFLPILAIGVILFFVTRRRKRAIGRRTSRLARGEVLLVLAYLFVGCAICLYVYVLPLDGADSFYSRHDMITHVNYVRSFADSGIWTSLHSSAFYGTGLENASYATTTFYPALWHALVAMVMSMLGCNAMVAINAVNAVVVAVVFPLSILAFLKALFPNSHAVWWSGAFVALAFTAFPWCFFTKGPLYPNLLGNAILPVVLAVAIKPPFLVPGAFCGKTGYWVFGGASFVALVFTQTNTLFTVLVFLLPYVAHLLYVRWRKGRALNGFRDYAKCAGFFAAAGATAAVVWIALYHVPFISAVVHFQDKGDIYMGLINSTFSGISFSFFYGLPQWTLVVCAVVGAVFLVARGRMWLLVPGGYMLLLFIVSRVFYDYPKLFFTGFWYSDPWRLAACAVIFLIPVTAFGLALFCKGAGKLLQHAFWERDASGEEGVGWWQSHPMVLGSLAVLLIFSTVNYFPNYEVQRAKVKEITPFGFMRGLNKSNYTTKTEHPYSYQEEKFLDKVKEVVPAGSLILNQPNDGSMFAYGTDGLNLYYRNTNNSEFSQNATTIREGLYRIADDKAVQQAVKDVGAKYVLQLDHGVSYEEGVWMPQYSAKKAEQWGGIDDITDTTPGFKVLLSEGDMRLYEITIQ